MLGSTSGRIGVLLATLVAEGACGPATRAPKAPSVRAPTTLDPAGIDAWLAAELASRHVVGASVVVVYDGATVFSKGYGTKTVGKQEPIDADTAFGIGSISKQFACAAVMQLADEGKLKLSDPVGKWYPSLVRANDITLDDLGAHLSGYRDYYPLDFKDARLDKQIKPDDLLARYAGQPLDFEPRSQRSYSNTGFVLLARIAEKVANTSYAQLLDNKIFKPLGMTHTGTEPPPGAATGHDAFLLGTPVTTRSEATGWKLGAMDLYASAADLARWDLAFASGQILSDAAREAMTRPHRTTDGREIGYGCGLSVRVDRGGERVLHHSGEVEGFLSFNTFVPRIRAAVILLVNDAHADVADLQDKLVQLVLERPGDIPVIPGPNAEDTARSLIIQLQAGTVDRSLLGEELASYWDAARLAEAGPRLRALGKLREVVPTGRRERGGMEVTTFDLVFDTRTVHATMFRSKIGKVHQLMLREF